MTSFLEPDLLVEFHIGVHPDGRCVITHTKLDVDDQPRLPTILGGVVAALQAYQQQVEGT